MKPFARSFRAGAILVLATSAANATAETVATVNGAEIDSTFVDMYIESRTQRPAAQATPEERQAVIQELTDIYLLTTQANADALRGNPRIKAQIELAERGILAQAVASEFFEKNSASEAEILAEYEKQKELAPKKDFKARHILVDTQAAAIDLIVQLDGGADFAELAKAHSTGPTGENGGDLGWFSPEQMVPEFSRAVTALDDGVYTPEPVQTQFGWHVILKEASRDSTPPTLEAVRDVIKQRVEQGKFTAYIDTLRAEHAAQ